MIQSFEQEIIQKLADLVEQTGLSIIRAGLNNKRHRGLDRIFEYLRGAETASLNVEQLCKIAGVSRRTLEYSFREKLDITPQRFIKLKRLHTARRQLLKVHKDGSTVADIAHGLGIFEQGRFASDYRGLFGELPSQTMMKAEMDQASPLAVFMP